MPPIEKEVVQEAVVIDLLTSVEDRLKRLGLTSASKRIDSAKRLTFAYTVYTFITQEKIHEFNKKLREETLREDKNASYYKQLAFIPLENYSEIPPPHVLDGLEKAKAEDCFDFFEIAKIQDKVEVKDPILFGRIKDCNDYFFIAQWDDDVRFEDILSMDTTRSKR